MGIGHGSSTFDEKAMLADFLETIGSLGVLASAVACCKNAGSSRTRPQLNENVRHSNGCLHRRPKVRHFESNADRECTGNALKDSAMKDRPIPRDGFVD